MLRVEKYGGSSVSSIEKIKKIANHLKKEVLKGNKVLVVFSAMGKTTNMFLEEINQISLNPNLREVDQLLVLGEMKSVVLGSLALNELGIKSISLNASQLQIKTDGKYNNGLIKSVNKEKILMYLEEYDVLFITGFQGIHDDNNFVTLGRGGSDTTAVALAKVLKAPCYIYTDVDGIYAIDPQVVENSVKYSKIPYDIMLEMASLGSGVLITRSVCLAYESNLELYLIKALNEEGTKLMSDFIESKEIIGISKIDNLYLISLSQKDFVRDILNTNISVDMLNIKDNEVYFVVNQKDLKVIKTSTSKMKIYNNICKISIIGSGISSKTNNILTILDSLLNNGIEIPYICSSELAISFVVNQKESLSVIEDLANKFNITKKH